MTSIYSLKNKPRLAVPDDLGRFGDSRRCVMKMYSRKKAGKTKLNSSVGLL